MEKEWRDAGNPTENLKIFYNNTLQSCLEAGIPLKVVNKKPKNKFFRQRRAIFRQMKRKKYTGKIHDLQVKLKEIYNFEKQNEEQKAVECIKKNPKYFYKFVKNHCTRKEDVAELKSKSGKSVQIDLEKANCLREQYSSVFSVPIHDENITLKDKFIDSEISNFTLEEDDLIIAVNELKSNSSPGPDKFPPMLLKKI